MSTILDALRRLEDEDSSDGANNASLTLQGRAASRNIPWRRLIALASLTMLVAGGALVLWVFTARQDYRPAHNTTPPEKQTMAVVSERNVQPSPTTEKPDGIAAEDRGGGDKADPRPSQSRTPMTLNASAGLTSPNYVPPNHEGVRRQAIPPQITAVPASRTTTELRAPLVPLDSEPGNESMTAQPVAQPPTRQDPYARIDVLPKDILQLQAISWSDTPTSRITIIAGNILREGQNVDGYTVVEIRPNDVIVEKAGMRWRLVYGGQ